jgi:hypothetical protein
MFAAPAWVAITALSLIAAPAAAPLCADEQAAVGEDAARGPMFVAVGYNLRRSASADGKEWRDIEVEVPEGANEKAYLLRGVTHGDGTLVAVGSHIFTSRDGREWREIQAAGNWLGGVAYGNEMFVAVGYHRSLRSRDGSQWSAPVRNDTVSGRRIAFGGGRFVAVGWMTEEGREVGYTTTTTDALDWANVKVAGGLVARDVAFGAGRFVIVGTCGLRESSADGALWEHRSLGEPLEELRGVLWTGSEFIAYGPRTSYTSPDGVSWKPWRSRVPSRLCSGDGVLVGCSAGQFSSSPDGRAWTPAKSDAKSQILDIVYVPKQQPPSGK